MCQPAHHICHFKDRLHNPAHKQISDDAGNHHHNNRTQRTRSRDPVHDAHQIILVRGHHQNTVAPLRNRISRIFLGSVQLILHNGRLRHCPGLKLCNHALYHIIFHGLSHLLLHRVVEYRAVPAHQISVAGLHTVQSHTFESFRQNMVIRRRIVSLQFNGRFHFITVGNRKIIKIALI